MQKVSGLEVTQRLRRRGSALPILMLADHAPGDDEEALQSRVVIQEVRHHPSQAWTVYSGCERTDRGTLASDTILDRSLGLLKVDFAPAHRQPSLARVVLATVVSLVGSLAIDAALVAIGEAVFPATKGYVHFRFSDYSKLTIIGVIIACAAWPVVTRISSAPRWLFFRLAIVVTLVLFLPDLYILKQGQPAKAVAVLMCMHLAIALVTYNALVHVAPVRTRRRDRNAPSSEVSPVRPS
jgi:CheY-like chemotaxis protein